jgi:hypothetical protein
MLGRELKRLTGFEMIARRSRHCMGLAMILAVFTINLFGCGSEEFDRATRIERGEKAVSPFKKRLMGALMEGLEDGPEAAIEVCQIVAPEIAEEVSSAGVELGRTSHKLRNERNVPRDWMQPLLDDYVATPGKTEPEVVHLKDGGVGYVEPIFVKRMCLACHGSAISPGVVSLIDEYYPRDQARDFKEGDFRGLFWVEFRDVEGESN